MVDWAERFDGDVAAAVVSGDSAFLGSAHLGDDGRRSHTTPVTTFRSSTGPVRAKPESEAGEKVAFPVTGFALGSMSMRRVVIG